MRPTIPKFVASIMIKLDVLIVTHGPDGLEMVRKMQLPRLDTVRYIVSWQQPPQGACSSIDSRSDIEVHTFDDTGSSRNHNHTIELARAPYCLLADNDLRYTPEGLSAVIDTLDNHPEVDVATFMFAPVTRCYPATETDVTALMPRGYSVVTFEIAYRREKLGKVRFDERFGINAPYRCAEDEVFFHDCRLSGLHCRFFPIVITTHSHSTTCDRPVTDPAMARGMGALLRHIHPGISGMLRVPLMAWRNYRRGRFPMMWGLRHIAHGFFSYRRRHISK